jgi:hypothetical protein
MPRVYLSVWHTGAAEQGYAREAFASKWTSTMGANLAGASDVLTRVHHG